MEDHLLLRGMASTYARWIHHGEPLHTEPGGQPEHEPGAQPEHEPDAHHIDDDSGFVGHDVLQDVAGLEEEDGFEDDRIPDLFKDLYESEPQSDGDNTIYAELIEEARRATSDDGTLSRLAFTVK